MVRIKLRICFCNNLCFLTKIKKLEPSMMSFMGFYGIVNEILLMKATYDVFYSNFWYIWLKSIYKNMVVL